MPNSRAEEGPFREEPDNTNTADAADEQDQDGPTTRNKRTLLEHREDTMDEHTELDRLLAQ